jgi:hypothetical protein
MTKIRYWSMDRFALMIIKMLLNKFDALIIIEGNRGLGKSTLAFELEKKINRYFRIIYRETKNEEMKDWYRFNPLMQLKDPVKHRYVIYTQKDVINFYDKWHVSAIADEMINVAFNREFFSEDQKNLVKMINMNRDHGNLLIACVPQFQNLDNQIKNLCKIRITIARRGLAVIQTPNRTIYNKDRWDTANNEKIERDWLKKGSGLPQYARLNTFRGMIRFKALSKKEQWIYDEIKAKERNVIKGSLGVELDKKDPFEKLYETLVKGGVRSPHQLKGWADASGLTLPQLEGRLVKRLKQEAKPHQLSMYYWDKKHKKQDIVSID